MRICNHLVQKYHLILLLNRILDGNRNMCHHIFVYFSVTTKQIITKLSFRIPFQLPLQFHMSPCDRKSCSASQANFDIFYQSETLFSAVESRTSWCFYCGSASAGTFVQERLVLFLWTSWSVYCEPVGPGVRTNWSYSQTPVGPRVKCQ